MSSPRRVSETVIEEGINRENPRWYRYRKGNGSTVFKRTNWAIFVFTTVRKYTTLKSLAGVKEKIRNKRTDIFLSNENNNDEFVLRE